VARSYLNKILISCLAKNNNLLTPRYILKCFPHGGDQELINASVLCEIHDIFPGEKKIFSSSNNLSVHMLSGILQKFLTSHNSRVLHVEWQGSKIGEIKLIMVNLIAVSPHRVL